MADVMDVFGFLNLPPGRGTSIANPINGTFSPLINIPPPGESDLGPIGGIITDIVQRIPIPRPRLPAPRLPAPPPSGRGPLPIPIPIPIPGGLFNGDAAGCPGCCKGKHLNKQMTKDGSPAGTVCVTNRRMNPLNAKALRRATRRLKGFERAVKGTRKQLRTLAKI